MSSFDERDSSATSGLKLSGLVTPASHAEQVPFPQNTPLPGRKTRLLDYTSDPGVAGPLTDPGTAPGTTSSLPGPTTSPGVTRGLPGLHTGTLTTPLSSRSGTTSLRQPVVIRPTHKKGSGTLRPPIGRKWVISISAISLLFVITLGTAFAVSPLGSEHGSALGPLQFVANLVHNNGNNPSLVAHMATATASTQDVVNPTSSSSNSGSPLPPPIVGGTLNHFAFGECTYWADLRYHQLTGVWVPWIGNAYQWAAGAAASCWVVSSRPRGPAILVLPPYVQGAYGVGHVAMLEMLNTLVTLHTTT